MEPAIERAARSAAKQEHLQRRTLHPNRKLGECTTLFSPDYAPEEIYEIAAQLMQKGGVSPLQPGDGLHSRFQGSTPDSPGASAQEGRKTTPNPSKPKKSRK